MYKAATTHVPTPSTSSPFANHSSSPTYALLHLGIKLYGNGTMSKHVASLQPGDVVKIRGPMGPSLSFNKWRRVVLLAGGSGIIPLACLFSKIHAYNIGQHRSSRPIPRTADVNRHSLSLNGDSSSLLASSFISVGSQRDRMEMDGRYSRADTDASDDQGGKIRHSASWQVDGWQTTLLHFVHSSADQVFRNDFEALCESAATLLPGEPPPMKYALHARRPSLDLLTKVCPASRDFDPSFDRVFVCGPLGFNNAVEDILNQLGYPTGCIVCLQS